MRRKRYRRTSPLIQNLDSFLDVLTNTVGVLMFVCLFASLVTSEAGVVVRTPLVSATNREPKFFECRANRVVYLEKDKVNSEIRQFIESLPSPSIYSFSEWREQIEQFSVVTSHYRVNLSLSSGDSIVVSFQPLREVDGDSPKQLARESSEFQQVLSQLDPQKDYLAFLVKADCFEAFRVAREYAWKRGFGVGWEPLKNDTPISFTSGGGGRSIGIQ